MTSKTKSLIFSKTNNSNDCKYFPLFLNIKNKKIVIFGGGQVSERKGLLLLNYANVSIYSSCFTQKL